MVKQKKKKNKNKNKNGIVDIGTILKISCEPPEANQILKNDFIYCMLIDEPYVNKKRMMSIEIFVFPDMYSKELEFSLEDFSNLEEHGSMIIYENKIKFLIEVMVPHRHHH